MESILQEKPAIETKLPGMKELLQQKGAFLTLPKTGDILSGRVIEKGRSRIFLDLSGFRTGVIYKSEFDSLDRNFQEIKTGDVLTVKVVELENQEGYVEVSLSEVSADKAWEEIKNLKASGEIFEIKILGANRGGLVAQVKNLPAFLPVSQLSSTNYPHVEAGDKDEILKHLKKFVGQNLTVKVIDYDQKNEKIILSEKAKVSKEIETKLTNYKVGDAVSGEISGVVDFGAFVIFDGIEGLIHISEMAWQLVEKPSDLVKKGDKIEAKIITIEGDKVSLSLKALQPNPWDEIEKKYQKGDTVAGTVVKLNPFGAFVKVDNEIQGLAHISEFKTYKDMAAVLELNQSYPFRITLLDAKEYKMTLQPVSMAATLTVSDNSAADDSQPDSVITNDQIPISK